MRVVLVLLVVAASLSGCSDSDDGADGAGGVPAEDSERDLAAAGSSMQPILFSGTTTTGACVLAAGMPIVCQYAMGDNPSADIPAGSVAIVGAALWNATSPLTEELIVYVLVDNGDGYRFDPDLPGVKGPSPLEFEFDLAKYTDAKLQLAVSSLQSVGAPVVFAGVALPQDFAVVAFAQ